MGFTQLLCSHHTANVMGPSGFELNIFLYLKKGLIDHCSIIQTGFQVGTWVLRFFFSVIVLD